MLETLIAAIVGALLKALADHVAARRADAQRKEYADAERRMREANARPRDPDDIVGRLRDAGL